MGEGVSGGSEGPLIIGLGGTTRAGSVTERLLGHVLAACESLGARTRLLGSADLDLPAYAPDRSERTPAAQALVEALRQADGVILATPGYHAAPSGLIKNAIDYAEDLRADRRPYLDGRAVGCLVTAGGWQAGAATLATLRQIVHALRGWPTPLGVVVNTSDTVFEAEAAIPADAELTDRLDILARQVVDFARWRIHAP